MNEPGASPPAPSRILVTDDDPDIRRLVCTYLELEGYEVQEAEDGLIAVQKAVDWRPDLILMDIMMPNKSGTDALADIRADFRTAYIPIVLLTAKSLVGDKVGHLLAGADDYIVKPFDPQELVARVEVALRRSQALRGLNPLTGLPGNTVITEEIGRRLSDRQPFACLYVDLDNFKAFNDHYGFSRGDELIKVLAGVILASLQEHKGRIRFAGHVGGDDFVALSSPEAAESLAQEICDGFDERSRDLYDEADLERGYIEV
ncbi:MAG TPA: response regulator, partial [Actinomycetota bacterium]|nr:response regulator [Actinomycetota bacterium]